MGRGAINFNDVMRVGLDDIMVGKMERYDEIISLMLTRLEEKGAAPFSHPSDMNAFIDGRFPHTEAAKALGAHLEMDWAMLTAALFIPDFDKHARKKSVSWPYDSGITFRIGIALRTLGKRKPWSLGPVTNIGASIQLLNAREWSVEGELNKLLEGELERIEKGEDIPSDYKSASDKAREILNKAALEKGIPFERDDLAAHLEISKRQASLIFDTQARQVHAPNWKATQSICEKLSLEAAPIWLALASEGLPFYQRGQAKKFPFAPIHGPIRKDFEEAISLIDFDGRLDKDPKKKILSQLDDKQQVSFEQSNWEEPYHQLADLFSKEI
jgi:hypothetical protein